MKKLYAILLLLVSSFWGISQDVAGSYDIPGFPRFKDSKIIWQRKFDFDKYYILKKEGNEVKPFKIEGEVLRTQYEITGEHSVYEIAKGYENIFKSGGYDVVITLDETNFSDNISEKLYNGEFGGLNALPHDANKPDYREHFYYIVAKKDKVYFVILLTQFGGIMMTVDRIEEKGINDNFVFPEDNTSNNSSKDNKSASAVTKEQQNTKITNNVSSAIDNGLNSIRDATGVESGDFDRLEIDVFVNFWDPMGSEIKSVDDVYVYKVNQDYYYNFVFGGFGQSINPAINISYFITKRVGLTIGGNFLMLCNEREYNTGDSSIYLVNEGSIDNLTFGFVFRETSRDNNFNLYYSFGFDYVTNYNLTMKVNDNPDMSALGTAMGVYAMTGMSIRLYKMLHLKSRIYYSFIPTGLEFRLNDDVIHEDVTLGGLGMMVGLGFKF